MTRSMQKGSVGLKASFIGHPVLITSCKTSQSTPWRSELRGKIFPHISRFKMAPHSAAAQWSFLHFEKNVFGGHFTMFFFRFYPRRWMTPRVAFMPQGHPMAKMQAISTTTTQCIMHLERPRLQQQQRPRAASMHTIITTTITRRPPDRIQRPSVKKRRGFGGPWMLLWSGPKLNEKGWLMRILTCIMRICHEC